MLLSVGFLAISNSPISDQSDSLTTMHGFKQIISDTTHILPQSSSCIDLIFTDQPNYVTDCGTHPSLHPNCHHQITFCKLNFKVEYTPPYERVVWNFKKSNNDAIKKAITFFSQMKVYMSKLLFLIRH